MRPIAPDGPPTDANDSRFETARLHAWSNHFEYETVSVNDSTVCLSKIVSELVTRLIELDVIRAGHDHHDDAAVLALLDRTSDCAPFARNSSTVASMSSDMNAIEW
jgi:hypothetical protein